MIYYSKSTRGFYDSGISIQLPADAVQISPDEHRMLLDGQSSGRIIVADDNGRPVLSPVRPGPHYTWNGNSWLIDYQRQQKLVITMIQTHMDKKAQGYGYDSILSAASYAGSSNGKWQAEGLAFRQWRDDVWAYGLKLLADVESGTNTISSIDDVISALPAFPLD